MSSLRLRLSCALLAFGATLVFVSRQNSDSRFEPNAAAPSVAIRPTETAPAAQGAAASESPSASLGVAAPTPRQIRAEAVARAQAFDDWLTEYRRGDAATQTAMETRGHELAASRRAALKAVIPIDPQLALDLALPMGLVAELPATMRTTLERRIDGRGDLIVEIGCSPDRTTFHRTALIADERFEVFTFGRRDRQPTKFGVPLHGVAIDGVLALEATPFRALDGMEKTAHGFEPDQIAINIGGQIALAGNVDALRAVQLDLETAEAVPGPHVRQANSGSVTPSANPATAEVTSPPSWVLGEKRVLWVKVDFSDAPGAFATDDEITATNNGVSEFYRSSSQGKTTMAFTILPSVLRLPREKAYYNTFTASADEITASAKTLAKQYDAANGGTGQFDPDRYDRWIVLFSKIAIHTFAGRAQLGGPQVIMHGSISPGTVAHELGHTQSLDHAHYWLPSTASAVGAGAHVEYGDIFDAMGSSSSSTNNFFNVAQKSKLGYLEGADVTNVTQSGTHRLIRHDHRDATGLRGLKIAGTNVEYDMWLEHRRFAPTNFNAAQLDRLRNGVLLHWGPAKSPRFTTGAGSYLIDATPGSAGNASDAALRIGEALIDPDAGITIKPLAVGGTAPNEYIDVQVSFGAVDGNRNPTLTASTPGATINARSNFVLNATATDPDNDPVYFRWDFGDGKPQPSLNSVTTRYAKGGTYTISVSAHDGRGGIDARKFTIEVVDPLTSWTRRAASLTSSYIGDIIFADDKFLAVGDASSVLASTDGLNWTSSPAVPTSFSLRGIAHNGSRYVAVGFRPGTTNLGVVLTSDDGATWTERSVPAGSGQLLSVAFGSGRFATVGTLGRIYHSVDGVTWTPATSPVTNTLRTISYAEGLFVVGGDGGRVLTSNDGINWTNRTLSTTGTSYGAAWHNGLWHVSVLVVATSPNSISYTSPDGVQWTRVTGPLNGAQASFYRPVSIGGVILSPASNGSVAFGETARTLNTTQVDATRLAAA